MKAKLFKRIEKLQAFKDYVHERLDKMGVPANPEPEQNEKTGCRIEGRLNYVEDLIKIMKKSVGEMPPPERYIGENDFNV